MTLLRQSAKIAACSRVVTRGNRRWAATVSVLGALLTSRVAMADASTRLAYERDPSAAECPSEGFVRAAVKHRLGYDPFQPAVPALVTFGVRADKTAFVVRLDRVDAEGAPLGSRELRSRGETCAALVEAAALSLSIALDPVAADRAPSNDAHLDMQDAALSPAPVLEAPSLPSTVVALAPLPAPTPDRDTVQAAPKVRAYDWHAGALARASWGTAPSAAAGFSLLGGVGIGRASFDLEARDSAPSGASVAQGGSIESSLLAASVIPCFHLGPFAGCAIGSLGRIDASSSGVTNPKTKIALFAAAGARVAAEAPLTPGIALVLQADLAANLARATLDLDGDRAWRAPALLAVLGAGAVVHFR